MPAMSTSSSGSSSAGAASSALASAGLAAPPAGAADPPMEPRVFNPVATSSSKGLPARAAQRAVIFSLSAVAPESLTTFST